MKHEIEIAIREENCLLECRMEFLNHCNALHEIEWIKVIRDNCKISSLN